MRPGRPPQGNTVERVPGLERGEERDRKEPDPEPPYDPAWHFHSKKRDAPRPLVSTKEAVEDDREDDGDAEPWPLCQFERRQPVGEPPDDNQEGDRHGDRPD